MISLSHVCVESIKSIMFANDTNTPTVDMTKRKKKRRKGKSPATKLQVLRKKEISINREAGYIVESAQYSLTDSGFVVQDQGGKVTVFPSYPVQQIRDGEERISQLS